MPRNPSTSAVRAVTTDLTLVAPASGPRHPAGPGPATSPPRRSRSQAADRSSQDATGFEAFFAANEQQLVRFCYLATLDREAAADAAQEAMARAWQRWDSLRDGRPDTWVRTVALNLCRSRWRRITRHRAKQGLVARAESHEPVVRDLDLQRALAALPDRQREAVVLRHLLGLDTAECAETMGVSTGTVKQHLHRGCAALASSLSDFPHQPPEGIR